MTRRRELWFVAPHQVEVRDGRDLLPLEAGEVFVRALASGVSQGTELLLYRGEGPTPFDPSLDPEGAPTYPRRYGYAWVGEVVESMAQAAPVGARVFALLPHGDEHRIRAEQARLLPPEIPAARAVLAANLETAVTAIWDSEISLGDEVVVFGAGTVGLLCGDLAKRAGALRVTLVEPSPRRRNAALAFGFDAAISPDELADMEADVVIEASGDPACLNRAIPCARREGSVVIVSFYGQRKYPLELGSDFHRRRLSLKASQVSQVPPGKASRWTPKRRFGLVVDLLGDARLDRILDSALPIDDAPAVYARLAADPGSALQTIFQY